MVRERETENTLGIESAGRECGTVAGHMFDEVETVVRMRKGCCQQGGRMDGNAGCGSIP